MVCFRNENVTLCMSSLQKLQQGPVFKYLIKELVDLEYLPWDDLLKSLKQKHT